MSGKAAMWRTSLRAIFWVLGNIRTIISITYEIRKKNPRKLDQNALFFFKFRLFGRNFAVFLDILMFF